MIAWLILTWLDFSQTSKLWFFAEYYIPDQDWTSTFLFLRLFFSQSSYKTTHFTFNQINMDSQEMTSWFQINLKDILSAFKPKLVGEGLCST